MTENTDDAPAPAAKPHSGVHDRALIRFNDIASATQEQRALSLAARRFVSIPGAQWEDADWAALGANMIRVEVNKTARGLEKITNDYRANRLTVQFRAVGSKSSEATAATLEGIHRADAYHFKAQQARDNAFEEAAAGGLGAYRLTTDYADPYDADDDEQRINPGLVIVDADQRVFFDLNSKLYDKSDAMFAFVVTAMTKQAFEAEYPGFSSSWPEGLVKPYYDWFTPDIIAVAEYYEIEETADERLTFTMAVSGEEQRFFKSELEDDARRDMIAQGWKLTNTRKVKRRRVHKYVLSGNEVLNDAGHICGDCIPIVPVYGKRWFIDNMERWRGHVQLAMDPQRVYNAQASKLVETSALAPREIPIVTPEQMAGHSADWARANTDRLPYLQLNPVLGPDGQPQASGPIGKIEAPQLSPVLAALIQISANDIAELTSADDGADQAKSNVSAEAMEIAATRVDAKSATYMDNMRQSVQREGEIYLSMARDVYYEPGREVETMAEDGSDSTETLHEGVTDEAGNFTIRNDIARGKYNVISDVTEATSTRRDKTVKACLNIASVATAAQNMELAAAALTTAVLQMDGEGMDDLQAWMRQQALKIGLVKPTDEESRAMAAAQQNAPPDPNAAVAQSQALALAAVAKKDSAMADKLVADTGLSKAKATEILAGLGKQADDAPMDAAHSEADLKNKHVEALKGLAAIETGHQSMLTGRLKVSHDVMNSEGAKGPLAAAETLQ